MAYFVKNLLNLFSDLLYPRRCVVCDSVLPMGQIGCCTSCAGNLTEIKSPYCMSCGKEVKTDGDVYCNDCMKGSHAFRAGRAVYLYDDAMRASMYRFKYHKRQEYGEYYGKVMAEKLGPWLKGLSGGVLIPVPVHYERLNKRGYNQAEILAEELCRHTGIPLDRHLLIRQNATGRQKELGARERENNLKKAFKTSVNDVKLDIAILVDDIYTTGATIDACARCLKASGVREVYFVTLCIGRNS